MQLMYTADQQQTQVKVKRHSTGTKLVALQAACSIVSFIAAWHEAAALVNKSLKYKQSCMNITADSTPS